jgi:hypothetical protein
MKIIIGASRNNKIGSRAIRWWIGADYSHSYVRWTLSTQERDIVYQASHGMVHFISLENFVKDNEIVEEIELDLCPESFKRFSRKCVDLAGVEYSKLQLLHIFLVDITNGKFKTQDQPGYICSELMCELLEDLGYKFEKPKYLVNPKDIIECLKKANRYNYGPT